MDFKFLENNDISTEDLETLFYIVQTKYLLLKFNVDNNVYHKIKQSPEYLNEDTPLVIRESNVLTQVKKYIKDNILNSIVSL